MSADDPREFTPPEARSGASAVPAGEARAVGATPPHQWTITDIAAAAGIFAFGLLTHLNTVLNSAYYEGSTLYDSAIFQTIIWRSGWALKPAPTITDVSYLNVHFSPINYLPSAVSYLVPIDRVSYFGLVYGSVYGALLVLVFYCFRRLFSGSAVVAIVGTFFFYLSGPVSSGVWEPHQEIASALFTAGFFIALGVDRRWIAISMLVLNATVREDCGMLLAFPLGLLWLYYWWTARATGLGCDRHRTLAYAVVSAVLSIVSIAIKRTFFHKIDIVADFYYGENPLAHLSLKLIEERLEFTVLHLQYIWMPGLVLAIGAICLRDARLVIGWAAFLPYWLANFFSIGDFNAQLISYKTFPFILMMIWPAMLVRDAAPSRTRLRVVQIALLIAALVSWESDGLHWIRPLGFDRLATQWLLHPETEQAAHYRAFESRLEGGPLGAVRASAGALALYPYSFPPWHSSKVLSGREDEAAGLDSLLWFDNDRDQTITTEWLKRGHFPYFYRVIGTRLRLAARSRLDQVPALTGAIEPMPPP